MTAYSFFVAYRGQPPIAREANAKFFANHLIADYSCPERAKIVVFENTKVQKQTICRSMRYRLFYAPDNASLIVRLTLEELQQPYETQLVDRAVGGQKHPDYLQHNPVGRIPTLLINDEPVFETAAILLHLAERHNAMAPAPADPARAAFLKWLFFVSNTLHADFRLLVYPHKHTNDAGCADLQRGAEQRMAHAFSILDDAAQEWSGREGAPTIIDYYVVTIMRWCALYPPKDQTWFDLTAYPTLHALAQTIETRPAVGAAIHAEGLNDTPFSLPDYANPPEGTAI
jgi:glutathione S-transferase